MATAYLLSNIIGAVGQSGFPAQGNLSKFTLQMDIDLGAVPSITSIIVGGQKIGNLPQAIVAAFVAADTIDIANIPANCAIEGAYINVTAVSVGTVPTIALSTVTSAKALVAAQSLLALGATGNSGADLVSTGALKVPIIYTAEDKLRLTFGGTPAAVAPFGKVRVTVEMIRL